MKKIAPSILSANFGNLQQEIEMLNTSQADMVHVDVMDGVFVPNISFGFPIMETLHKYSKKPLDVHLMIVQPEKYVERFCKNGASFVSFHLEAVEDPVPILEIIKKNETASALAINPDIDVNRLFPFLHLVDMVLIMSVFAGFGGQKFIPESLFKIETIKNFIIKSNYHVLVEVDGGINLNNAADIYNAGADILVAGSAIFQSPNPIQTINQMKML